jgi:rubrerythrin
VEVIKNKSEEVIKVKLDTIEKVIDFAIRKEQDASDFYSELAAKMDKPYMKEIFEQFSLEEQSHKAKLEQVKGGKIDLSPVNQKIMDLKIADTLTTIDTEGQIDYQAALIFAMKTDKASFKLYNDLAELTDKAEIRDFFFGLAQEEAKHKLRFEIEYDENILTEN